MENIDAFDMQNSKSSPEVLSMYVERFNYTNSPLIVFEENPFVKYAKSENFVAGYKFLLNRKAFVVPLDLSPSVPFLYKIGEKFIFFKLLADEKTLDLEVFLVVIDIEETEIEEFVKSLNVETVQKKDIFPNHPSNIVFFEMKQKFEDVYKILSISKIVPYKEFSYETK